MPRILLLLTLWSLGRAAAQTGGNRLGFDLGLSPVYVLFDPNGTDNWSGDKATYATMALGSINWNFPKDHSVMGLGGGAFFWGNRVLYPVYFQIGMTFSGLYRDTTKVTRFAERLSIATRIGTMLGTVETTTGKLTPMIWYDASIMYRLSRNGRSSFHLGMELSLFSWRGPYQVRTGDTWEETIPQILTAGPVVQFRF